jgi:CelD/BcsL family acetyltransferase involved in cellulose biosynthesis
MTWRWITTRSEFAGLAADWDAAVAATGNDNPFLLSDFLIPYAEAFVAEGELRVLVFSDNGRVRGGLPLFRQRRRRWPHVPALRYLGLGFANLTEPFHPKGGEAAFAAACSQALGELRGWRFLDLPLARTPWWRSITDRRWRDGPAGKNARLEIDRPAADYVSGLSAKMQANLRRCRRHAAELGEVSFGRETSGEAIAALVEFQLRHNGPERYAADVQVSPDRAAWAGFTRTLLLRLAAGGKLDAMALRVGGKLAAAGFGLRYGPGYKSMLISYDPELARCGPGLIFFEELIDWCRANGDRWIDMYADSEGNNDKRRWCRAFAPLHRVQVFSAGWPSSLLYYGSSVARPPIVPAG